MQKTEIWTKLEQLQFDDLDVTLPFSARLARDNGWSRAYALRVIEEYKRFAYLAALSVREVTPSDEVDQAWHLHLTYTRHYWGPFTETLGEPLHHGPTAGGSRENERYLDNYEATLALYEREFGRKPPRDIWPSSEKRFGDAPFMRRVNLRNSYHLPRKLVNRIAGGFVAVLAMTTAAAWALDTDDKGLNPIVPLAILMVILLGGVLLASNATKKNKSDGGGGAGTGCGTGGKSGSKSSDGNSDGGSSGCGGGGCGGGCGGG